MKNIEKIVVNGHYVYVDKDAEIKEGDIVLEDLMNGNHLLMTIHTLNDIDPEIQAKVVASSPELNLEGIPSYVEWLGINELKLKWSHLYVNGQLPKKPYPTNFENDLDKFMLGYYTALEKELFTEEDMRKAIELTRKEIKVPYEINGGNVMFDYCYYSDEEIIDLIKQSKK
jgi:hypothetical protein